MTSEKPTTEVPSQVWVPEECTLPTAEQPLRVAEFDELFATALRHVERVTPTTVRLTLDRAAGTAARELAARETACCSFFTFTFTDGTDGHLVMSVTVPAAYVEVLAALTAQATAGRAVPG